jgi:hypothetical protein
VNVTFLLTGQRGVFEKLFEEERAIERIIRHVPISVLDPDDSRHILNYAAGHAALPFTIGTEAQDMILALATGHPYAVHLLGNAAFGCMESESRITLDDLLRGLGELLESDKAEKYMLRLRDLDEQERLVLMSMSLCASSQLPIQIPPEWIPNNLLAPIPEEDTLDEALDGLVSKDYLVEGPRAEWYRFRDELFRVFLSQFVYAHREREEERLAQRRQELDVIIGEERRKEMKRFRRDYRQSRALDRDKASMLEYALEMLNVADVAADWDWKHFERSGYLRF